ncbi:MAG: hypothetical protein KIT69_07370, partial [Propionibacteriaceae bacterium]|nr:hypothetical protein [Propionibacteriaceae bacterium]
NLLDAAPLTVLHRPDQPPATAEAAPVRIKIGLKTYQHGPYDLWYLVGDDGEVSTVGKPDYSLIPAYITSPAATVKPSVEAVAAAIDDRMNSRRLGSIRLYDAECRGIADTVLALLPGRTEAEVKAEAYNEGVNQAVWDVVKARATHAERGWTAEHDAEHGAWHLVGLAVDRLLQEVPWSPSQDLVHPLEGHPERSALVKATSLLVAAIELLDRVEQVG